ncbi:TIGR03618 family F420-dependent PPOX class oxidoreductase [Krasilnikoviella flava]|uniref:PPOX class probable F420-dependent enzyme n=1 Tax=Krasilnikoviella flava TaxID=526729 RepID=A0A1T5IDU5_9MICO|nr:TIGR03618 family F420-dependent PPOX class oxidoreductase [Krasilnikoviella flava]SKC37265.1 PPOX class probable F420-dependent enzyme [Krasilnikoviella flava]
MTTAPTDGRAPLPGPAHLPDLARTLVAEPHVAHLATLLPDGSPHSVPLWVAWEGARLAFLTGPRSQKARNVDRDPRVAISVAHTERPWEMAMLRGRVDRVLLGDTGWAVVDRISHGYTGADYPRGEDRIAFLVDVEHAIAQSFR